MTANVTCTVEQTSQTSYETHIAYRLAWFVLLAVQAYNLSSELPTQTHQMDYLASRMSFSDIVTPYRKTSLLMKLSNVNFAEFFTSPAKI